jgi:hypothetical protein
VAQDTDRERLAAALMIVAVMGWDSPVEVDRRSPGGDRPLAGSGNAPSLLFRDADPGEFEIHGRS